MNSKSSHIVCIFFEFYNYARQTSRSKGGFILITITIDDKVIQVEENTSVLEAALSNGIYIPHLCHHPDLPELGSCRLCIVEIEGEEGVHTSCSLKAKDGMVIHTRNQQIDHLRTLAMELLLAAHPEHCTSCPKYGRCEMQLLIQYMDATGARMHSRVKKITNNDNPLIQHDMLRCVLCGRCVRACKDLRGVGVLDYNKHNMEVYVGTLHNKLLSDSDCRFCGACAEVCPTGAIRDVVNYTVTEKKEVLLPCVANCPAHTDIPSYLRYAKDGEYAKANAIIHEKLLFPECLGRVCMHKCELNCRHKELNDAVSIREVKRVCAENDKEFLWKKNGKQLSETGKHVAVVGGGPAGITAAVYLRKQGHDVTLFEANAKLGGQMQYGIPAYRLPRKIVDKECSYANEIGIHVKTNTRIFDYKDLAAEFDAVISAVGTHNGNRLPLKGNDLEGVLICSSFLKAASMKENTGMGEKVFVLGGGNVAFDCARSALRLGAKNVYLACLESKEHMLADEEEIKEALEEGVIVMPGRSFEYIQGEHKVSGMCISKIKNFTFDENRRAILEKEEGSEEVYDVDTIIFAVGQKPELDETYGLVLGKGNTILTYDQSSKTSLEKVFACGDAVTGTKSVVEAIVSARKTASEVDIYLGGDGNIDEQLLNDKNINPCLGKIEGFSKLERLYPELVSENERKTNFEEISKGLCSKGCDEASRCLQCDLRFKIKSPRSWTHYQNSVQEEK